MRALTSLLLALALALGAIAPVQAQITHQLGPASATANGYVTTGTQTIAGDKTFSGTTTLGTTNITAFTLASVAIFNRTSASSTAEAVARFKVSDDASNYIEIGNNTTTNSSFAGYIIGSAAGTNPGVAIYGQAVTDTGTNGLIAFHSRIGGGTTVATRPLVVFKNVNTDKVTIYADGSLSPGATGVKWFSGSGSPESAYTAPIGSLYTRTDGGAGTTLYVKESGTGNTGWVAK